MNRLCIYMTYNKENRIYEYISNVLCSLKECCSKVYLVCNYPNSLSGLEYAVSYVNHIFYRENRGYDSGAYKDVLCQLLGWDEVEKYDEIVLVNDSFFGFFYPLQDTFRIMDEEECDFWGMTGQDAGEYTHPIHAFNAHIHSYFLVFKRTVIKSTIFREFWETLEYPRNFREAIVNYELKINDCLKQKGFIGRSFTDVYNICLKRNENPAYSLLHELIKDYKIPIMKKKCVLIRNTGFSSTLKAIRYLEQENLYPVDFIFPYLENQFHIPEMGNKPCNSLEVFYNSHRDIYIYGYGVCGKNLAVYFDYKGWKHKGFIVTESSNTEESVIEIEDAEIHSGTGIIISVINAEIADKIAMHIGSRCRRDQLFFIADCPAIRLPD